MPTIETIIIKTAEEAAGKKGLTKKEYNQLIDKIKDKRFEKMRNNSCFIEAMKTGGKAPLSDVDYIAKIHICNDKMSPIGEILKDASRPVIDKAVEKYLQKGLFFSAVFLAECGASAEIILKLKKIGDEKKESFQIENLKKLAGFIQK